MIIKVRCNKCYEELSQECHKGQWYSFECPYCNSQDVSFVI